MLPGFILVNSVIFLINLLTYIIHSTITTYCLIATLIMYHVFKSVNCNRRIVVPL